MPPNIEFQEQKLREHHGDQDWKVPEDSIQDLPVDDPFTPLPAPDPPKEVPERFIRACEGNEEEAKKRYEATLAWRKEYGMDTTLTEAHPNFELIKANYPHFFHLTGHDGESVFYDQPPRTDLQKLKDGGVDTESLLHHYVMVTEFQWQFIDRDDLSRSITVIDLKGMRMTDFAGECKAYVQKCSEVTNQNYPERAGYIYVINVPRWFNMVWKIVKPWVDPATLEKITVVRGEHEVLDALLERIPIENIPEEYGGKSMPLGQSPEEELLRALMQHNIQRAEGDDSCGGRPSCCFCSFQYARSY